MARGGTADSHVRWDLDAMRAESQRMDRDNGLFEGLINRSLYCILGPGMAFQACSKSDSFNKEAEARWVEYWESPESRQLDDGAGCERLFLRHLFVDGDTGTIKNPKSGLIQIIEAERITSNKTKNGDHPIILGVELDSKGNRPVAFYVADYDQHGRPKQTSATPIKAADFIFKANRKRISQTRGTPVQQSNFPMFHRINAVCDSEAIAWQILSRLAVAINRKDEAAIAEVTSTEEPGGSTPPDLSSRYHDIGEAIIFHGEPGEDIRGIDRNIPGANFTPSLTMYLRLLGLPIGLPLELVALDWSRTNYSSARASIKQAERMFKRWQRVVASWLAEIYVFKVQQWVKDKKLRVRGDMLSHQWHAPPYPFIDPQKEAQAQKLRFENGVTSPTRECKEAGLDLSDLLAEQERDMEAILEVVARLNTKYPGADLTAADFTGFVRAKDPGRKADRHVVVAETPKAEE